MPFNLRRAWAEVRSRRAQFAAVGVTIMLGVALFGAAYDAFQNLTTSYQRVYQDLRFADLTITGGLVETAAVEVADEPEVESLATRTVADVPIRVGDHRFPRRPRCPLAA